MTNLWRDISCALGSEGVRRLVAEYGGTRIYVPERWRHAGAFVATLGEAAARALHDVAHGVRLHVPRTIPVDRSTRDDQLIAERRRGTPVMDLAKQSGLTERQVYNILARP